MGDQFYESGKNCRPDEKVNIIGAGNKDQSQIYCSRGAEMPIAHSSVISVFEKMALNNPLSIAVCCDQAKITYLSLRSAANDLASRLVATYGIKPGDVIAIMLPANEQLIVALLAVLKACAIYLPVDPTLPEERSAFMIANSNVKLVITESRIFFAMPGFATPALLIDHQEKNELPVSINLPFLNGNDSAYIIYTSGTTGNPKGAVIEHQSLVNMVAEQIRLFGIKPSDKVLQFASISFDASISEFFMALCSGAMLIMFDRQLAKDNVKFIEFLRVAGISVITLPPSYISVLSWKELVFLRAIISAGERLHTESALYLSQYLDFFNAYGPSEYTVCATINKIKPGMSALEAESLGSPIGNTTIFILDADLQILPPGTTGEICIAGAGTSKGYIGLPELTSEKFISDRLGNEQVDRFYRTGDLGLITSDGKISYHGRIDEQVKIRGYRIEPGEIEQVIVASRLVKQSAVIIKGDDLSGKRLVAFIIPEASFDNAALLTFVSNRLPEYMQPASYVILDEMPVTNSGKIDKNALLLLQEHSPDQHNFQPPQTVTEEILVAFWKELLACEQLGTTDNLFEMGADSLSIIRTVSFIKEKFSVDIPLELAFDLDNITTLAGYIDLALSNRESSGGKDIEVMVV
jgi:amino acid adenylation domain-containing protein